MENKINIAELLKDCPTGMELDCTTWENVTFKEVRDDIIIIVRNNKQPYVDTVALNKYGRVTSNEDEKCRIFPKGKTTWEGFQRPFVEGDVIYVDDFIAILSNITESGVVWYHCYYCNNQKIFRAQRDFGLGNIKDGEFRFATEDEKAMLFKAIKDNGYRWNPETKTLDKLPKFKVGDRITNGKTYIKIGYIDDEYYYDVNRNIANRLFIKNQDEWNLVPSKFDISKLKPFDEVLVRDFDSEVWEIDFFSKLLDGKHFKCHGASYVQCIPYKGNEYLHNTTNTCNPFYKTWEK
jgi:hypothetical protein